MHPSLKQSWVSALRSWRYTQTRGSLRRATPDGWHHCAVGVLFDLVGSEEQWDRLTLTYPSGLRASYTTGPADMLDAVGLSSRQQSLISCLNDLGGTFDDIADVIEADLESETELAQSVQREVFRIRGEANVKRMHPSWDEFISGKSVLGGFFTLSKPVYIQSHFA